MKPATATASRSAGGCTITTPLKGNLSVSCSGGNQATLTYAFALKNGVTVKGTPGCGVTWVGSAQLHRSCSVVSRTIRVTVTVTDGWAVLSSVNVGYYT